MRIFDNTYSTLASMPKDSMQLHKDREIIVYRSCDPDAVNSLLGLQNKVVNPSLDIICFDFDRNGDLSETFLRLPGSDLYIELMRTGSSSCGGHAKMTLRNPVQEMIRPFIMNEELVPDEYLFYKTPKNGLLSQKIGIDFFFMNCIAFKQNSDRDYRNITEPNQFGEKIITEVLNSHFVKIPELRDISYACKTSDGNYIIVDHSAFKYQYHTMRAWYGKRGNLTEVKIKNLRRMRDGGTTQFEFEHQGIEHSFFYPQTLTKTDRKPTLDELWIFDLLPSAIDQIAKELGILRQPKTRRYGSK